MREIKFRGKRVDNGAWVCGIVIKNKLGLFISDEDNPHYCDQYGYIELDSPCKVIPETFGQYTGLKDKNGVEIYEGDILLENTSKFSVEWDARWCRIKLQYHENNIQYPEWNRGILMEVIGNIHDVKEFIS